MKQFNSTFTMFVYLRGHHLLEYYFNLADPRRSANDMEATRSYTAFPGDI